jgi:hypothetical protein
MMSIRFVPAGLVLALLLTACGDGPTPPPVAARCDVSASNVSSNPPSTAPAPPAGSPLAALVDDFAGPAVNQNRWAPYDESTVSRTVQDDRLVIAVAPNTASYSGLRYRFPHSVAGTSFSAEIGAVATGGPLVETVVGITAEDEEEYVLLTSFGAQLQAVYHWRVGGCNDPSHERTAFGYTYCQLGSVPFNPTAHRFRRIREQNGNLALELSADGSSWTAPAGWILQHRFSDPGALHGLVAAGSPASYASTMSAHFENVNTTVPAISRGLGASCPGETQVRLTWERRSVNEAGFRIERRVGGGAFAQIGTVAAGVAQFVDTDTRAGSTYEYRVRATNDAGDSGYTRTVTVAR